VPTRTRVVLAAVASNLPDLDLLLGLFADPMALLNLHRGISHSFLAAPLLGLWLIATLAVLLHCGLDLLTSYGTQVLAPFSARALALPVLFIVDPLVWLLLAAACALAWQRRSTRLARDGLLALGAYIVVCGMAMLWATRIGQAYAQQHGLE